MHAIISADNTGGRLNGELLNWPFLIFMKRSLVPTLPDMTGIGEGGEDLIGVVALGNVDELEDFLRPDILRVSLVIL